MTLAVAVVTADGIVVAADSRTTFGGAPTRVLSDFTHKVFRVGNVAVATSGFAFLNGRNIAGHMGGFVRQHEDDLDAAQVADRLKAYFADLLETHFASKIDERPPAGSDVLSFLVAGYSDGLGILYEVALPTGSVTRIADSNTGGAAWRGQTDVMVRLIKGFDGALLNELANKDPSLDASALEPFIPTINQMEYQIPFGLMNMQDAIDFAVLAIRTTIDVQRLTYGSGGKPGSWPGVGGPIEIGGVTAADGFDWVQRTELQGERSAGSAELV